MSTTSPNMAALTTPERLTSPTPGGRWLSNGNYSVLLTRAGTGASRASGYALTRWTADRIEDHTGFFVFVRDTASGEWFSVTEEPAGAAAESRVFSTAPGRVRFVRQGQGLEARLDVCVLADRDAELRRLTITNTGAVPRTCDVTSWADVVLNHAAADASHPAFSKLFVQTEWDAADAALLARRRPRANQEHHPWLAHALVEAGAVSYESDRVQFLGREGSPAAPRALRRPGSLGGGVGNVLDPVVSLRRECALAPGESATFTFALALAPEREGVLDVVRALRREGAVDDAFARAASLENERRARHHVSAEAAEGLQALAAAMAYGYSGLRAAHAQQARQVSRPGLHGRLGLDERVPQVLAWCENGTAAARLRELERACGYWNALGYSCEPVGVLAANAVLAADVEARTLSAADLGREDADALAAHAAAVFLAPLAEVAEDVLALEKPRAASKLPVLPARAAAETGADGGEEALREWNGFGGFSADGREYVIRMPFVPGAGHRKPPLPWVNIMASERFGFLVSETGAASTWNANSREHRLTPWHNDPVLDPHGEALHLRDEESGEWWSPSAGPSPAPAAYEMRHGFGWSLSRHESHGLAQEVCWFAHESEPVRATRVRVTNRSGRARRLSLYAYARLVQGVLPEVSSRHVVSGRLEDDLAMTAVNPTAGEFAHGVAFSAVVPPAGAAHHATADREEYLGTGGSVGAPAAVSGGAALSGACGAGLDPCFADQVVFELASGATAECVFLFGEGDSEEHVRALVQALRAPGAVDAALEGVRASWERLVSGVQVRTPSAEIDLMVNGWLAYQTLSCRIWGRTAYYQSGGAYGFRDQLQDAASLLHLKPELTRAQILRNASHQFVEGDVLHWWHPPLSKGMRTRFADDLLWLPLLTTYYLQSTGDWSVLDEPARFLTAPLLADGEDEVYLVPTDSGTSADVYEHCCRAIDRSLEVGEHGLPLFGTGDWNDGMNRVGREGRGESVWMGFFLHAILGDFVPVCERRGDHTRAARYERHRDALRAALNDGGWDGEWYRRAYYDDGAPLGSKDSDECRIDGLAQAWSVLSHAAPAERANLAMDSVEKHLVSERDGIIRLLTPAFRDTPHDPGYIKGYVAGVRENGGQYTHGVLWVVRAMAELGRRERAAALLAMLSPVRHTSTPERVARYQTEPYVIVADVYGEAPHVGRGGWTWYTGSAGWMFRIAVESVLGVTLVNGESVRVKPCIPDGWPGYEMEYRIPGGEAVLEIRASNPSGCSRAVVRATLDGSEVPVKGGAVLVSVRTLTGRHRLEVTLGAGE
ncbi:MAG: glycosyl transferase [Candidatus Eisenbacteria bacterium]|uniref:Glycosyl transferase n=1 Tax=Eiseniibacteriota bacterium TaxID=2212470 RepID=A0A933SEU2_UNCEI|nr:glycosyl transferase [Candidatus Eisenbacteria bacterium]